MYVGTFLTYRRDAMTGWTRCTLCLVLLIAFGLPHALSAQELQADANGASPDPAVTEQAVPPAAATPNRQPVDTAGAPAAMGPYSQAIQVGSTVFVSGQVGVDPASGLLVMGGIGTETRQAMNNVRMILRAAGYTLEDIVHAEIFLTNLDDEPSMSQVYSSYFFEAPPARSLAQVARLPNGASIQIAVTAAK